jgi:SAM-dependent methyltransferase
MPGVGKGEDAGMGTQTTTGPGRLYRLARSVWHAGPVRAIAEPLTRSGPGRSLKQGVKRALVGGGEPVAETEVGGPAEAAAAIRAADPMVFLAIRNKAYQEHISGEGIEIGAFEHPAPLPKGCVTKYVDRFQPSEMAALFPEIDTSRLVDVDITLDLDSEGLSKIGDATQDYVIFNHVVEHVANPISVLGEIFRVLKPGGRLAIGAPDRDCTFDKDRPVTTWAHLEQEYREGVTEVTDLHYVDFLAHVHPELLRGGVDEIARQVEIQRSRREHPHVWTSEAFREFLEKTFDLLGLRVNWLFEATSAENGFEYFAVLEKSAG